MRTEWPNGRCWATNVKGEQCRNYSERSDGLCITHGQHAHNKQEVAWWKRKERERNMSEAFKCDMCGKLIEGQPRRELELTINVIYDTDYVEPKMMMFKPLNTYDLCDDDLVIALQGYITFLQEGR